MDGGQQEHGDGRGRHAKLCFCTPEMMKTFLKLAALLLALSNLGQAQTANWVGWCFKGGQPVITQGLGSTNPVMATYPNCTVTVYLQGTTTLATIFADKTNTPL